MKSNKEHPALAYHAEPIPGKLAIVPTKAMQT
jgi:malate dehydrogenase (oxaloacetate-decarboxylating)(NADP+)